MIRRMMAAALSVSAIAATAANSVSVVSPQVEFGELQPEAGPAVASVNLVIHGDSAWRVTVMRDVSTRQRAIRGGSASAPSSSDVLIRSQEGTWTPLMPGIAVPVASGMPTDDPAGVLHTVDFQMTPTMDMAPGARQIALRLLINGQESSNFPLSWSIASAMRVAADDRDFHIVANEPSHNRSYAFEPRVCIVTSNVPWTLETYIKDEAKAAGEGASLSRDALRVTAIDGQEHSLLPGGSPVAVAAGPPTGRAGTPVQVHLTVVAGGVVTEGAYKTQLQYRITSR